MTQEEFLLQIAGYPIMFGTQFRASARIDWEPFYRAMGLEDSGDTRERGWKREGEPRFKKISGRGTP